MRTLIISLPIEAVSADTEFYFVVTDDGVAIAQTGRARAEALPLCEACIATAPLYALSWHQVSVPEGVTPGSTRMRAVLDGLLEDKLLDDPALLHFVMPPTFQAGVAQWMAVCDRRWLAMAVQGLEVAKRPVARVVPEWGPPGVPPRWHVTGTVTAPQLMVCGASGIGSFPLSAEVLDGYVLTDNVSAEPALVELVSQILQRPVAPLSQAERMVQTSNSTWDLSKRLQMRNLANRGKLEWLVAPRWRSARWAAMTLVGVNLLGLNTLAWVDGHQLAGKHAAMQEILTSSFPNQKNMVDVPAQMAREVRFLEQAHAAPSAGDLDVMLGVLSPVLPTGRTLKGLDYTMGQLRLIGLGLNSEEASALNISLNALGYNATRDGTNWLIQPASTRRY